MKLTMLELQQAMAAMQASLDMDKYRFQELQRMVREREDRLHKTETRVRASMRSMSEYIEQNSYHMREDVYVELMNRTRDVFKEASPDFDADDADSEPPDSDDERQDAGLADLAATTEEARAAEVQAEVQAEVASAPAAEAIDVADNAAEQDAALEPATMQRLASFHVPPQQQPLERAPTPPPVPTAPEGTPEREEQDIASIIRQTHTQLTPEQVRVVWEENDRDVVNTVSLLVCGDEAVLGAYLPELTRAIFGQPSPRHWEPPRDAAEQDAALEPATMQRLASFHVPPQQQPLERAPTPPPVPTAPEGTPEREERDIASIIIMPNGLDAQCSLHFERDFVIQLQPAALENWSLDSFRFEADHKHAMQQTRLHQAMFGKPPPGRREKNRYR